MTSGRIFRSRIVGIIYLHVFCMCLSLLCRRGRGRAWRVAGTCKHEVIIFVAPVSAHLVNTTVVKHFFYNAPALNALPVHLLRQVYFFVFWGLFLGSFSVRLFGSLKGACWGLWGRFWSHLGSIWGSFLCLFWRKVDL